MSTEREPFLFIYLRGSKAVVFYTDTTVPVIAFAVEKVNFRFEWLTVSELCQRYRTSFLRHDLDYQDMAAALVADCSEIVFNQFSTDRLVAKVSYNGFFGVGEQDKDVTELRAAMTALRNAQPAYADIIYESSLDEFIDKTLPHMLGSNTKLKQVKEKIIEAREKWKAMTAKKKRGPTVH